jgi:MATE family multidrug resistance protein
MFKKLTNDLHAGDSLWSIVRYWFPELISQTIIFTLPPVLDSYIIASSQSILTYGALGMTSSVLHTLFKLSEAIPVAAIAIIGRYNGAKEYEKCGAALGDIFWTTFFIGFLQFVLIFLLASNLFVWLGVSPEIATLGVPFLRIKSLGLFLTFIAAGLLGFIRAVKNTRTPMIITVTAMVAFVFFDYALVLGKFGFPNLSLTGSGLATIIQYGIMNLLALGYILLNPDYKKYFVHVFFSVFNLKRSAHILNLSWPIIIDKSIVAWSYVWLSKLIAPMGTMAIASYDVVKNMERFAFLPAVAAGQIITFLVSNRLGAQDHDGANANVKKILLFTAITTIPSLIFMCVNAEYFISFFDQNNNFTAFATKVLPFISLLVIFDFTQVVLAGALRGAGDIKTVMVGRFVTIMFFFVPFSWFISKLPIESQAVRFTMIYGSFYIATGIIGVIFLFRMKSHKWQKIKI